MQTPKNPNKQDEIQNEFNLRLEGLCGQYRKQVGLVVVASTLVVHAARYCAELGEQFVELGLEKWKTATAEFRQVQTEAAQKEKEANDNRTH